ncbi:N-acetylmuramic acid 6-phosphate etherase [Echinicola vietnamensis]|uniref:N-acetylmuramic acid 6-phosphate etherase n=1 Tax=Echinicola vietnamensis (strain DSM 17526 / LMG 23754 / KMM 6221) TaxID=926556 RepID=L0FWJ1_ECHVK|nr:N-acetylmuramic acid 6-phosphate etherase [Echinicola vietnamensis]AGA78279.1 N-acetylmuramic acid 6-phosphate etherase [Echinicola vietnamensis DSM 17526]
MSAQNALTTETSSLYEDLDKMNAQELLTSINQEDQKVAVAVQAAIPQIEKLITAAAEKMVKGGRLFYIGAGTSGRLGILDASEIPPTYGASPELVCGLIAGGDSAIRHAVEGAEDDLDQAWVDLKAQHITENDILIGIAASGRTPYVRGGLQTAKAHGVMTGSIACNANAQISGDADFPIEVEVGPEFVTGSTRMKAGTAQKLVLNMISTSLMIMLGKVKGNKMVNMQLSNQKLVKRGTRMILEEIPELDEGTALKLLTAHGSVKKAIDAYQNN